MKRVLPIIAILAAIAVLMAACNRNPVASEQKTIPYEDTAGLSQFQAWKAMNERQDPMQQYQEGYQQGYQNAVAATKPAAPARKTTVRRPSTTSQNGSMTSTSTNTAQKKKGWSKAAKYSVIGGATGGVLGAVINKKDRVKGGVIGAILGAGGGYVLGRSQDKKDGRVQ
jgi:hypothetical protein